MTELQVITALIRDGAAALNNPDVARSVILARTSFKDEFNRTLARQLLLFNGDWRSACRWLESRLGVDHRRLKNFRKWAEKVSAKRADGSTESPPTVAAV